MNTIRSRTALQARRVHAFATMLLDRRISRDAFTLYAFYSAVADDETRTKSWWSLEQIGRIMGVHRNSVRTWRKELAAVGLIEIEHHADVGRPSTVWLTDQVSVYGADRVQNFLNEAKAMGSPLTPSIGRGGYSPMYPPVHRAVPPPVQRAVPKVKSS